MSAYYTNSGYEEDPDYPPYPGSQNHSQGYLKTRDYLDLPGPRHNRDYPGTRNNVYPANSRTNTHYAGSPSEADYPGAQQNPDYPSTTRNPYAADVRAKPDYHRSQTGPDDTEPWDHSYRSSGSFREQGAQRTPDVTGSRSHGGYSGPRTNPDYFGSLEEPDYPGAQSISDYAGPRANPNPMGSRRNLDYDRHRTNPYAHSLDEPDYPGAGNQPNSPNVWGEPDYPVAEGRQRSSNFWGEPDYPDAEGSHDDGSSQGMLRRISQIQPSVHDRGIIGRQNGDYPESIEMTSVEMVNSYGHFEPCAPGPGYVNAAFAGESSPEHAYRNPPLSGRDWHLSPEGQKLIASLIPLTPRDRNKAIRNQPKTMEEKRKLRTMVDKEKRKSHHSFKLNCCTQCLNSISLAYRRSRNNLSELLDFISLWQKTLKVIGGKFGTSVLSYFNFLKWLLKFNIFSFIVNFSFLVIPQLTMNEKNTLPFTGLEFLTGAGYFGDTVMYYGFYTNSTIGQEGSRASYNMPLAYIFTIGACLVVCFFSLLYSMARYFRNNFINPHIYSRGIAKLIFCWDFTVTHEKAVKLKQKNLSTEIKENLSEIRHENISLTVNQRLLRLSAHAVAWVVSTGVAIACCVAVYYLALDNSKVTPEGLDHQGPEQRETGEGMRCWSASEAHGYHLEVESGNQTQKLLCPQITRGCLSWSQELCASGGEDGHFVDLGSCSGFFL